MTLRTDLTEDEIVPFLCTGCGMNTLEIGEYYSLHERIWYAANNNKNKGMKCLTCVEETLGRELTHEDFTGAPVNFMFPMSRKMYQILLPKHEAFVEEVEDFGGLEASKSYLQEINDRVNRMALFPDLKIVT